MRQSDRQPDRQPDRVAYSRAAQQGSRSRHCLVFVCFMRISILIQWRVHVTVWAPALYSSVLACARQRVRKNFESEGLPE